MEKPKYIKLNHKCIHCRDSEWFRVKEQIEIGYELVCHNCNKELKGIYQEYMPTDYITNPLCQEPDNTLPGIGAGIIPHGWMFGYDASKRRGECRRSADDFDNSMQFHNESALCDCWFFQRPVVGDASVGKLAKFIATIALKSENQGSGIGEFYASLE